MVGGAALPIMQIEANYSSAHGGSEPASLPISEPVRPGGKLSSNRQVAVVQADYVALANDLDQARELTAALEMQLSGKCNEVAQIKHLWERTRLDMQKFEKDLEALRKERHGLANQVQVAYAIEHRHEKLQREHGELTARAEVLASELSAERTLHADARRALESLTDEVETLRRRGAGGVAPGLRSELQSLRDHLDRILETPAPAIAARTRSSAPEPENIGISFGA